MTETDQHFDDNPAFGAPGATNNAAEGEPDSQGEAAGKVAENIAYGDQAPVYAEALEAQQAAENAPEEDDGEAEVTEPEPEPTPEPEPQPDPEPEPAPEPEPEPEPEAPAEDDDSQDSVISPGTIGASSSQGE